MFIACYTNTNTKYTCDTGHRGGRSTLHAATAAQPCALFDSYAPVVVAAEAAGHYASIDLSADAFRRWIAATRHMHHTVCSRLYSGSWRAATMAKHRFLVLCDY